MREELESIRRELATLAARLEALERRGLPPETQSASSAPAGRAPDAAPRDGEAGLEAWQRAAGPAAAPPPPPPPPPRTDGRLSGRGDDAPFASAAAEAASPQVAPSAAPSAARSPAPSSTQSGAPEGRSIEQFVGARLAAWIGALVVILAGAFFFKYAYDRQLFGRIAPEWRCALGVLFGLLLIGAGELALRRAGRAAAVGFLAAGAGVVQIALLAAWRVFDLFGDQTALVVLALGAAVAFLVAARSRSLVVGVIALIAGYLGPALLVFDGWAGWALAAHLTLLLAVALALSALMPRPFRTLRLVALPLHGLVAGVWLLGDRVGMVGGAVLIALWWSAVFLEALLAALRRQSIRANPIVLLGATAWSATLLIVGMNGSAGESGLAAAILVGMALSSVGLVATLCDGVEPLRRRPESAPDMFAVSAWLLASVLLAAAASLQFPGGGSTFAWSVLALAAVEMGRRIGSRGVAIFGSVVGSIVLLKAASLDLLDGALTTPRLSLAGDLVHLRWWSALAAWVAAMAFAIGARLPEPALGAGAWRGVLKMIGGTLMLLGALEALLHGSPGALAWIAVAATLVALAERRPRLRLLELGTAVLLMATVGWLIPYADAHRGAGVWQRVADLRSSGAPALVLPLLAAWAWVAWRWRRRAADLAASATAGPGRFAAWVAGAVPALPIAIVAATTSVEILERRADRGPYASEFTHRSIWLALVWTIGGLVMAAAGQRLAARPTLRAGLAIALLSAVAWVAFGAVADTMLGWVAATTPLVNLQGATGLATLAALIGCARIVRAGGDEGHRPWMRPLLGAALLVAIVLGSLEVERLARLVGATIDDGFGASPAMSVWWALAGVALVVGGFARRLPPVRHAGLALLGLATAKFLIVDLQGAENVWRAVALLCVGLLLVATSVVYVRVGAHLDDRGDAASGGADAG